MAAQVDTERRLVGPKRLVRCARRPYRRTLQVDIGGSASRQHGGDGGNGGNGGLAGLIGTSGALGPEGEGGTGPAGNGTTGESGQSG